MSMSRGRFFFEGRFLIIVTKGEKWDSLTRNWHDHSDILSSIKLFLVDEVCGSHSSALPECCIDFFTSQRSISSTKPEVVPLKS